MPKKKKVVVKKKLKSTTLKILYSFLYSILLIAFLSISSFLILTGIKPQSFPFITKELENYINQNLNGTNQIEIGEASVEFRKLSKFKVDFSDIKLNNDVGQKIILPKIEAEFSLFNLILLKYLPSKIKIIEPEIEIDNANSVTPKVAINGIASQDLLSEQKYSEKILQIFESLKKGHVVIKNFEIENAKIIFKNKFGTKNILLKSSIIKTSFSSGYLNLMTSNIINFNKKSADLTFDGDCKFGKGEGLKCDLEISNFVPKSIVPFDDKLAELSKINTNLNGKISLAIDEEYNISSLIFKLNAKNGSFNFPQFFSKEIDFKNFVIDGELKNSGKIISISNLDTDFGGTKFSMSMLISDFMDPNLEKTEMQFKAHNLPTNDLEKLWPVFLTGNNVRSWVTSHVSSGNIKDAYASISLKKNKNINKLDKVQAEIIFSGLKLAYSPHFPEISEIDGVASFSKKDMKIDLVSGNVLDSKIKSASISIDDFHAKKLLLNISGISSGNAADSLKHIDYKSDFASKIEPYFNGNSENSFTIKLPLSHQIDLKSVYIAVNSDIKNFNNSYITGDSRLEVSAVKEFGSSEFAIKVDLLDANIDLLSFGISKQKGKASKMATSLSFEKSYLHLKNFIWTANKAKIAGDLLMHVTPFKIIKLDFSNSNFGNNNFALSYLADETFSTQVLKIAGLNMDLDPFMKNPMIPDSKGDKSFYKNNIIQIDLSRINLANDQKFKNLSINLNCSESLCNKGFARADMGGGKNIDINVNKKSKNNYTTIEGRIKDISVFLKALDISNKVVSGDTKINAKLESVNDKNIISGDINIDSEFSILKNDVVEEISKQSLFSKIKNNIIDNNQTNFNSLKLEFELTGDDVEIKSLIASSYFLGITAKGKISFSDGVINLRGLIVPGYSLNRLFGLGDVPIIGSIISPLLVGEKGGGIFAARYEYDKKVNQKEGNFKINPASAIMPGGVRNIFDLF